MIEGELTEEERYRVLEAYNSALMQAVLVSAICKHDDVSTQYFEEAPHDTIGVALPAKTLAMIWGEYETLAVQSSPIAEQATNEDLNQLKFRLEEAASGGDAPPSRVLRLARLLLDEMKG